MFVLKPSEASPGSVGVQTDTPLRKGITLEQLDGLDYRFVRKEDVPKHEQALFDEYAVETREGDIPGYYAPTDWHRMSVAWFLRNSDDPNLDTDNHGATFYTKRPIAAGTELTIPFKRLDPYVDNSSD